MSTFERELKKRNTRESRRRRWIFVPYDQLSDQIGPLARLDPQDVGIIQIDSAWKARRRPYHRQKLALVMANQRHFALEQAARGVAVRFVISTTRYRDALAPLIDELGPIDVMQPAEFELRADLAPLVEAGKIRVLPHEGWLTTTEEFLASQKGKTPWRMDAFYRHVRQRTGILMKSGKPVGGKYSFDHENRERWRADDDPAPPTPPNFEPDEVTREIRDLIERHYADHPGRVDLERLPATKQDAERLWRWALRACLEHFGPYEDAMSTRSRGLFHTRISPLLNLHRLLPQQVLDDALAADLPRNSQEGFVRQVIGWREFIRHVHEQTDGLRRMPETSKLDDPPTQDVPGDGGYARWAGRKHPARHAIGDPPGGAAPAALGASRPLPVAYWGKPSGLNCLDTVVDSVWDEGWSHHITRLMVLGNIATLLDVSPRELTDWFWVAYLDAYDWVVEPNVLGMGTYGLGDLMITKPYVSGAAYIHRMSDYCDACAFHPKSNCPLTPMYWAFLARHESALRGNPRIGVVLRSLAKRSAAQRAHDQRVFEAVSKHLAEDQPLRPEDVPELTK